MLEYFLSLLGMSQQYAQRAEDRKQRALTILPTLDAVIIETAMTPDFEIARLRTMATAAAINPDIAVKPLGDMRAQCDQLREIANTNRASANAKGASVTSLGMLEQWAGTCSLLPKKVMLSVQHIEATITRIAGQR